MGAGLIEPGNTADIPLRGRDVEEKVNAETWSGSMRDLNLSHSGSIPDTHTILKSNDA